MVEPAGPIRAVGGVQHVEVRTVRGQVPGDFAEPDRVLQRSHVGVAIANTQLFRTIRGSDADCQASFGPVQSVGKRPRGCQGRPQGFGRDVGRARTFLGQDVQIAMGGSAATVSNVRVGSCQVLKQERRLTIQEKIGDLKIAWKDMKLNEVIGTGGYAKVYRGHWRSFEIAVKEFTQAHLTERSKRVVHHEAYIMGTPKWSKAWSIFSCCLEASWPEGS
eukprot:scaffold1692_cov288-Pavlova_lutheri.AAC.1